MKLYKLLPLALLVAFLIQCSAEDNKATNEPIPPEPEYTKEAPGQWKGKEAEHLPNIKVLGNSKTTDNIRVTVEGLFNEGHYIEKVGIMDENKNTLSEKVVGPGEEPNVVLSLDMTKESYKKAKIYVKCISHDLWTQPIYPEEYANTK
jgi:desulfoferrodoxin (superoxide reductase-like protein)